MQETLFNALFGVWALSVMHGVATSDDAWSILARCPLLGGEAPPPEPVPLWAYGVGHVLPGWVTGIEYGFPAHVPSPLMQRLFRTRNAGSLAVQLIFTLLSFATRAERNLEYATWQRHLQAFASSLHAMGGSAPLLCPLHKAFLEGRVGHFYFEVDEQGCVWLCVSGALLLIVTESWFYWVHRMMHANALLYKYVHKVHHNFNPAFTGAGSAFHPADITALTLGGFVLPSIVPLHHDLHTAFLLANLLYTLLQHSATRASWGGGVLNDANLHNIHHDYGRTPKNCGSLTCVWDRLAGTYEPRIPERIRNKLERNREKNLPNSVNDGSSTSPTRVTSRCGSPGARSGSTTSRRSK